MNLDDLRAQLQNQATEIEPTAAAPLPAIRRRSTTLRRRRAATVITSAAAAVALAVVVLPNAIHSSAPDPAKPPADYTRDGITVPGTVGADRLEKAEVGKPGGGPLRFDWTPTTTSIRFRLYCRTATPAVKRLQATVNGRIVAIGVCGDSGPLPTDGNARLPGDILWLEAPPGKAAEVRVFTVDQETGLADATAAQVALGIYRTPAESALSKPPEVAGLPVRTLPDAPGDYIKDGVRFRARVAGDTLLGATIGEIGQRSLKLSFTATSRSTGLRLLCTGNRANVAPRVSVDIRIAGRRPTRVSCSSGHTDVGLDNGGPYLVTASPGQTVEATVELVDEEGRELTVPGARLGIGAYSVRPPRPFATVSAKAFADEVVEYGGYTYRLTKAVTTDASSGRQLSLDTPAGKPFIVAYSSVSKTGPETIAQVVMRSQKVTIRPGQIDVALSRYISMWGQPAGEASKATLRLVQGRPTQGMLILALYLPE